MINDDIDCDDSDRMYDSFCMSTSFMKYMMIILILMAMEWSV